MPKVALLNRRTGEVTTTRDALIAAQAIGTGEAVETVPVDPKEAKPWLAELRKDVLDFVTQANRHQNSASLIRDFEDFEAWCAQNRCRALPTTEATIVRYLLTRVSEGKLETYNVAHRIRSIAIFHSATNHPPGLLIGDLSRRAYERAMAFSAVHLRSKGKGSNGDAAVALELYPDGNIPMKWTAHAA